MELQPNCSESVVRIKTDNLTHKEKDQILNLLEEMRKTEDMNETELFEFQKKKKWVNERWVWYETLINEKSIFGTNLIEIKGEVPYNCYDWLMDGLKKLPFYNKLKVEEDGP